MLHKSPASARFSLDDFDENDVIPAQADCSVPAFAENLDEKRPVVGTICSFGFEGDPLSAVTETHCQSGGTELEGHEHTVQLLETGGDGNPVARFARGPMIRRQNRVSTREASGAVSSGRRATEPVVLGKRAKTKLLLHDKSVFDDPCRRSTPGFFLR